MRSVTTSNYIITPELIFFGTKIRLKFNTDKITYTYGKTINIYSVYGINRHYLISSYPTLEHFLFGAVRFTMNDDIGMHRYSGYGIGFGRKGKLTGSNGSGRSCINFWVHMS